MNKGKITIILAEDHAIVRQGLLTLLEVDGTFQIVGQARTGRDAVELAAKLKPNVILMDIAMPELNGLEATRQILEANGAAKVLVLSAHSDDEYIEHLTAAGVMGFLEKQTSAEVLTKAIHEVAAGRSYFSPTIAKRMAASKDRSRDREGVSNASRTRLSSRETEVLQLVAEGQANKQVASVLGISIKTVEKHRQRLMDKLNIHETAGLTRYAISHGVIEGGVQFTIV